MVYAKDIKALRMSTGLTNSAFSRKYGIPRNTLCNWEIKDNQCPESVYRMLRFYVLVGYTEITKE